MAKVPPTIFASPPSRPESAGAGAAIERAGNIASASLSAGAILDACPGAREEGNWNGSWRVRGNEWNY